MLLPVAGAYLQVCYQWTNFPFSLARYVSYCYRMSKIPTTNGLFYRKTEHKMLNVILQFPENYPHNNVVVELTSKTLSDKLLGGLTKMCDEEAKKRIGDKQVSVKYCETSHDLSGFL